MFPSHRSCTLILSLIVCCWPTLKHALAVERFNQEIQSDTSPNNKKYDHRAYGSSSDGDIYLEGIEDLNHLSYLSLRNYNLTDEGLLQSSRLVGVGTVLTPHKLHQIDETASVLLQSADKKTKLPLLLESFISHLRNGRLKRMSLSDIEATSSSLNLSEAYFELRQKRLDAFKLTRGVSNDTGLPKPLLDDDEIRCIHLVTLYKFDLAERQRNQLQSQQQSKVEYENGLAASGSQSGYASADMNQEQQSSPVQLENGTAKEDAIENRNDRLSTNIELDENRLIHLCKLAIVCRSADELIGLISKPWKDQTRKDFSKQRQSQDRSQLERDTSIGSFASSLDGESNGLGEMATPGNQQNSFEPRAKPRNLRDSLSLSLAKICPMILFPLHEDEGQCSLRRDDRPPMITVWAFATLFVTIVCFCSLIGLSITPLLGRSATSESTTSSDLNEPLTPLTRDDLHKDQAALKREVTRKKQEHKASLTLFEGLAVGSLVGSALFSLIPQAFELQERESNHSFLLKAFIIFSGIYLFFCSERIMRIILDTRQMRKKKKRQSLHRSSTTAAMDGIIVEAHPQQQSSSCNRDQSGIRGIDSSQPQTSKVQVLTKNSLLNDKMFGGPSKSGKKSNKIQSEAQTQMPPVISLSKSSAAAKSHQIYLDRNTNYKSDRLRHEQQSTSSTRQAIQRHKSQRTQRANRSARTRKRQMGSRTQSQNRQSQKQKSKRNHKESDQFRQKRAHDECAQKKRSGKISPKRRQSQHAATARSDIDNLYYQSSQMNSSSSDSTSSSTSSLSSYTINRLRETHSGLVAKVKHNEDSQLDYSFSSSSSLCSDFAPCSSCASFDSDQDNNQAKAVSERMREFSQRLAGEHLGHNVQQSNHDTMMLSSSLPQLRATFKCGQDDDDDDDDHDHDHQQQTTRVFQDGTHSRLTHHSSERQRQRSNKQDISTVAWMIVLGDGLHNFIDGISIGAAFSESILSGVSISVAVICEEFPHELGDFAVLVSAGMTVRQALGYNFLSACTCYVGMAVGIILGDVTDGASYISALAAGVFLYIALVDMMGELSAALEESSRDSITRTLKLLLLQNVGIFIGISIIFVLSFIDF